MKKIFSLALSALLTLSLLTACGTSGGGKTEGGNDTSPPSRNGTGTVYQIADYYDADGGFSGPGLALEEENGEKVLKGKKGDTLIVGEQQYKVTAETLTIPFYTQNSLDGVIEWWTDYCESRVERGEMQKAM